MASTGISADDDGSAPRRKLGRRLLDAPSRLFDALDQRWERLLDRRTLGLGLVVIFLSSLLLIELNRRGVVAEPLASRVSKNHFQAVAVAFLLLLLVEVLALVFALARSVAISVGKQFELLSLILLRKAFLAFGEFGEPLDWATASPAVLAVLSDLAGALLIFIVVGLYYRVQRHRPITTVEEEQASFIAAKKSVALVLLLSFVVLAASHGWALLAGEPTFGFFETFYTILIFSDILIVLISLAYTSGYHVVFRNSGFAAATIIIRLVLTAPDFVNAALGLGAALFVVALSVAHNHFASEIRHHAGATA